MPWKRTRTKAAIGLVTLLAAACGSSGATTSTGKCVAPKTPVLTLAAYSTPREAYGKIIPAFQAKWKADHNGQNVIFQESYGGSTTQAQNVIGGFEADVIALSLAPDVDTVKDAGLITRDWTSAGGGMVSASVVAFDVRPGNPSGIVNFGDLAKSGTEVLTPDPASSGGARWNIVAAYGAALRGQVPGYSADEAGAQKLLTDVFRNVTVLDKTARDSIKNFESGNGDAAITYENEVLTAQKAGLPDEMVIPPSTVLIENPVAVVDKYADKHCAKDVADAFVGFLHGEDAQSLFKSVGFLRSADVAAAAQGDGAKFAAVKDLFTVEDLGGWDEINEKVFDKTNGIFTKAFEAARG